MAKFQHYHCSACNGVFKFFHALSDSPPPDCCQICGAVLDEEAVPAFVPKAPGIRKSLLVASENKLYRQMEASSIQRAKEAADVAGVSEKEMSHIKITNMREAGEMREGDTAAIMPAANPVAQVMRAHPGMTGFNTQQPGSQYALGRPDAGANVFNSVVKPNHAAVAGRLTANGQIRPRQ